MLQGAQSALAEHREDLARGIATETGKPITEARGEVGAVIAKFDLTCEDAQQYLATREITGGPHPAWVRTAARGPPAWSGLSTFLAPRERRTPRASRGRQSRDLQAVAARCRGRRALRQSSRDVSQPAFSTSCKWRAGRAGGCLDHSRASGLFHRVLAGWTRIAQALAGDFAKDLALELGGRNATIVCADADLELAAMPSPTPCLTCGQRCNSTAASL
jgi:succinylglutamic semialdehyde dehydrogenase